MRDATIASAQRMLQKARETNVVQARVEVDNLKTRGKDWVKLSERHVPEFPRLSNQLRDITFDTYQIKLSSSYVQDKIERYENEKFQLDVLNNEPGLIRVRIYSRFRNRQKH